MHTLTIQVNFWRKLRLPHCRRVENMRYCFSSFIKTGAPPTGNVYEIAQVPPRVGKRSFGYSGNDRKIPQTINVHLR